jgi:hypothetical protein
MMTTLRENRPRPGWRLLAACLAGAAPGAQLGAEGEAKQAFDLPAGVAEATLLEFSVQSGRQVIFPTEVVRSVPTREVKGEFSAQDALDGMLRGTPLAATMDAKTEVFAIVRRLPDAAAKPRTGCHAIVVVGLTADDDQAARMHFEATNARDGLLARGVPAEAISVFGTDESPVARREALLDAIHGLKPPIDETWLVLLGQVAPSRDGEPAFQVSGPRLSAEDFAGAVGALPGKKYVVLAASGSGGFLPPLLAQPQVEAVAATAESGEINEPRFSQFWLERFRASPDTGFRQLSVAAAIQVEAFYRDHELAQGEHAKMIDRATGKILDAPFGATAPSP